MREERSAKFQKNYTKVGLKKLLRARLVPARNLGSSCSGENSHGKVKI